MPNELRNDLHKVDATSFEYIYEENVTITLQARRGIVRCNVYRPKDSSVRYPALVTYGPYGKDVHYEVYVQRRPSVISMVSCLPAALDFMLHHTRKSPRNTTRRTLHGRLQIPATGLAMDMQSCVPMKSAWGSRQASWTQCQRTPALPLQTLSSGLRLNHGALVRSGCLGSATTRVANGG